MGSTLKFPSPCNARKIVVEEEFTEPLLLQQQQQQQQPNDKSKLTTTTMMNLRGAAVRAVTAQQAMTSVTRKLNSHDDTQEARKLQLQQTVTDLQNGVTRRPVNGETSSSTIFALRNVPAGEIVTCVTSGIDGNVDLYVKIGDFYDIRLNPDCYSLRSRDVESCSVGPIESPTDVFIDLHGVERYSVTLTCYYAISNLQNGVPLTITRGVMRSHRYFTLRNVPVGARVNCATRDGTGNVDLFVKKGVLTKIRSSPDCSSRQSGNEESCEVGPMATPTDVYVEVCGIETYTNVTLTCNVSTTPPI